MLRALVTFSIRFPGVVLALACVVLGYGIYAARHAKFDVFPEFTPPQIVIQTEAPGLAPEETEALVTRPVESAVNGVVNLKSIRSESAQGLSVVTAVFQDGTDIYRARQMTGEALTQLAGQLPAGVRAPIMSPLTSATDVVLVLGLTSEKRTPMELRTFADWTLRPRLLGSRGVARVTIYGGEIRQLQIQVKPEKLLAFDLTIDDVLAAGRKATGVRGSGFIETPSQRIVLQSQGQMPTPEVLGEVVLAHYQGSSIRLKDVADVVEGPEPKFGDAIINGQKGILMELSAQFGANTLEVTEAVEEALAEFQDELVRQEIKLHPDLFRPANFIHDAISNVTAALMLGGALVTAVLLLFLFNLRVAFISLTAIPLSLLVAVIVLDRFGGTLNTLTLGGLAIAIGEVVDDAIIDVENIFRRLRLHPDRKRWQVVLDASMEVRSSVVYATFVVALVFLPVMTMSGLQGRLFAPLGLAYILAVMASLLVALTVTPALSLLLLTKRANQLSEPPLLRALKAGYQGILRGASKFPVAVMGAAIWLCIAGGLLAYYRFGADFLPEFREGHIIAQVEAAPGTSLAESIRLGQRITAELMADKPDKKSLVKSVGFRIGRASNGDDTWPVHKGELDIELFPMTKVQAEHIQGDIRDILNSFPGVNSDVKTFLTDRIEETIAGSKGQVAIKIFGEDLDLLDKKAQQVKQVVSAVTGAQDVKLESAPGLPQLIVRLKPEALRQFGFSPIDVLESLQAAYQGVEVAQTYHGYRLYDVTVVLTPTLRREPETVGDLVLRNAEGSRVYLHQLADVFQANGRHVIAHENARRRQTVTCNVKNRDLASFVAEIKSEVKKKVDFPKGTYPVFSGTDEARIQAQQELLLHSTLAGFGILVLLAVVFENLPNLCLVLVNLPFALLGGVLAAYFFLDAKLSIGSLVGFVTLFGITTRNSIMLISHYEHLVREEGLTWGLEAALRGAAERLAPILMTALVTALGLLPLALKSGEAGREIEGPMAIVILGGLATSTVLNLLVLPTLALRYGRFAPSSRDIS